ncbi:MAG: exodeoxyribonuclease III [Alphaproteobacteria bacterium]
MSTLKIATWNINSVRLRIESVKRFLAEHKPDVLCLQETKVENGSYPSKAFEEVGYPHLAINGQKGYHGVAIASRLPLEKIKVREFCGMGDTRHVSAIAKGVEVHSFYVPAGGDEPDPAINPKFQHKLDFLDEMEAMFKNWKGKDKTHRVIVGDLNIAPLENDVWSHKQLLKVVSHTPVEVEALERVFKAGKFSDVMRDQWPEPERLYTWWSYRSKDYKASNRGRRLDHIWVSPSLKDKRKDVLLFEEARGWEKPSDHCPVMVTLKV